MLSINRKKSEFCNLISVYYLVMLIVLVYVRSGCIGICQGWVYV